MCAPKAPDPIATGSAQTATNIGTAVANQRLNQVNQVTPDGSLTYEQTGTTSWTDPVSGKVYDFPTSTATQTLSEAGQQVKDASDGASINLANFANTQSGRLDGLLAEPVDLSNDAVESRLFDLGSKRLDPRFEESREGLQTQLSNQGIKLGSEAYDRAMGNFGEQENDAYNQLALNGRAQSVQEILAQRNQPINEISALLSGSQVSQPNFVGTPQANVATTDYAGLINNNYQQEASNYNNLVGGLFGLGSSAITGGVFG